MKQNNTGMSKALSGVLKNKTEALPSEINDVIQPTISIVQSPDVCFIGQCSNATSATITTLPTDRDFYLTYAQASSSQDGTATNTIANLNVVVGGNTITLFTFARITLFGVSNGISEVFIPPTPLKLDRGSIIGITHTTNVANARTACTIHGFYGD